MVKYLLHLGSIRFPFNQAFYRRGIFVHQRGHRTSGHSWKLYIAPDAQIALHGPTHFVQGNITTDPLSPSPLWIAPTASIVAASPAAYSEAPIHSLGHDDLLFATGKEGTYHPLRITNGNNSPLTVDYVASGPVGINNTQGITSVSNAFHWTLAGSQQAEVTLSWSAEHQITTLTDRVEDLIIVGYDGFNWQELPATLVNGSLTQGALTTTAPVDFSNYSALTIGTKFSSDTPIVNQGLTPNGDGANDGWVIEGIENHPDAQIRVFSRWGREVFAHNGPTQQQRLDRHIPIGTPPRRSLLLSN